MAEVDKKQPRRIRKVETMREKAEKSGTEKPGRLHKTRRVASAPFRATGHGVAKVGRRANRVKPLRFLGFVVVPPFVRNSWRELRQVSWPTGRESRRLTLAVIIFAVIFGVFITLIDTGLDKVFKEVLLK